MPIVSGGGGGGGLPTGWTQSGSPADVDTHGGQVVVEDGSGARANLQNGKLFLQSSVAGNAFVEVDSATGVIFYAQQTAGTGGEFVLGEELVAPPDGDLSNGQAGLWFDDTNGASKLMVKAKSANGTVVTAAIALA